MARLSKYAMRQGRPITKDVMDRTPNRVYQDDGEPWPGMGHITRPTQPAPNAIGQSAQ